MSNKEGRRQELEVTNSSPLTASPHPHVPVSSSTSLLDLRGTPCPINFVRTKLKLEQMPSGEVLEVWLDPGEPIEQVPDSLTMEGYKIESIEERAEFFSLKVCRPVVS
jgi:TusA-related sulfurtransferase